MLPPKLPVSRGAALKRGSEQLHPHTRLAKFSRTLAMRLLFLTILAICCLSQCLVEGVGSEVPEQSICVSLTTQRLPVRRIKTYTIKEGPMKAVIFITRRGIKVCADPQDKWVKAAIKSVDNRSSTRKDMIQSKPTTTQQTASTAVTLTG
ncbi:lymphotactin-like isoform 1-T1 [Thomomys bottae]